MSTLRFIANAATWCSVLFITFRYGGRPFQNVLDVYLWLILIAMILLVTMWPRTGKDLRQKDGQWADGVEFKENN
ncbi:MAG: hypothetical protein AAFR04_03315 [Pseudomonadota bacterium]